jgi:UDP-N-acetylglucosamine--N-acetylmuramyl-(pentapeptide) pyrophosphoryl-undecaprenol N-acetylglucosamine transferase
MQKLALEPSALVNAAKRARACGRPDATAALADLLESLGPTPLMDPIPVDGRGQAPFSREAFA